MAALQIDGATNILRHAVCEIARPFIARPASAKIQIASSTIILHHLGTGYQKEGLCRKYRYLVFSKVIANILQARQKQTNSDGRNYYA